MAPHRGTTRPRRGAGAARALTSLLLLCALHRGAPFGLTGSEVRARRAPLHGGVPAPARRRDSARGGSAVETDAAHEQKEDGDESGERAKNATYVRGLLDVLETHLDKWIVSGSMPTRRKAFNVLQQIDRLSEDEELARRARRMAKRAGMPLDPPPAIPPTEHIPAVDQPQKHPNTVHKPMGAMVAENIQGREEDANERLAWEKRHRDEAAAPTETQGAAPRSALSARTAGGGDPLLDSVVDGLEPLTSFGKEKKELQDAMNDADTASAPTPPSPPPPASDKPKATFQPTKISTSKAARTLAAKKDRPSRAATFAAAKASELIATAGAGDAFRGDALGVGGLDDVLAQIKRRVWIPLAAPPALLRDLGIAPVRGLLLYGAPGCGKTLLARKLGGILSPCRPVTIVSGPEILDKFVGSSEKNLREVFDSPPDIYPEYKKNYGAEMAERALHVIVLDEFDAISRRRGGSGGTGGDQGDAGVARDSVVNQLLAKMDGVDGLGVPTLLVGLTNKPALIDPALMRPGRFEVQIEVPKPRTVEQRTSILRVHMERMRKSGRMLVRDAPENTAAWARLEAAGRAGVPAYAELLDVLAVECAGMSGASLAGVARAAAARALERAVTDFAGQAAGGAPAAFGASIADCVVTREDFEKAVEDVFEGSKGGDYTDAAAEGGDAPDEKEEAAPAEEEDGEGTNGAPP